MKIFKKNFFFITVILLLLAAPEVKSQILAPAFPQDSTFVNAVSFGSDLGYNFDYKSDYLGLTLAYARKLNKSWVLSGGASFDIEKEDINHKEVSINTFSGIAKVSYYLTKRWTLTTGFSKGFANDDNINKSLEMTNGDLKTGLTVGADIPEWAFWKNDIYALSISYLYNLTQNDSALSFGIIVGGGW